MQKPFERRLRLNNQIRVPQVRVVDADGKALGILQTNEALRLANEKSLDLVEVGPSANPPVAKIMDYGKYMYQKERKEKKGGKSGKSPTQEIKTVRIGLKTGPHDLEIKADLVEKFLEKGHKVKVELTLRGREKAMANLGFEKIQNFLKTISSPHIAEEAPKRAPWGVGLVIKPSK